MLNERLLKQRNEINKRRPKFVHTQSWMNKNLSRKSYRVPTGKRNKMRLRYEGKHKIVRIGYKGPAEIRGLLKDGSKLQIIQNMAELMRADKNAVIIIAGNVGLKKKLVLLKKAGELGLKIANASVEKVEDKIKVLQAVSKARKKRKEDKQEKPKATKKKEKKQPATSEVKEEEKKSDVSKLPKKSEEKLNDQS